MVKKGKNKPIKKAQALPKSLESQIPQIIQNYYQYQQAKSLLEQSNPQNILAIKVLEDKMKRELQGL